MQKNLKLTRLWLILIIAAGGLCNGVLHAETAGVDPLATIKEASFEDWRLKCGGMGLSKTQCYLSQDIFIQESGVRLLGIVAGYLGPDGGPWLFFRLPLGVFLPAGMAFSLDGGEVIESPFRICTQDGCQASIPLEPALLAQLKQAGQAKAAFLDGNTGKQVTVEVSLKGFTRGFTRLEGTASQ